MRLGRVADRSTAAPMDEIDMAGYDVTDEYFLKPHVLEATRREREQLLQDLRRTAADADEAQLDLFRRTITALEICELQLSLALPPAPIPKDPAMDRRVTDLKRQIKQLVQQDN